MKKFEFLMVFAFLFSFLFSANAQAALSTPTVETYDVDSNDIGMTSAVLQGEIIKNGGYDVTDYGFYYGTSRSNLKYKVSLGYAGDQKFRFEKDLTGLDEDEKYYYKAYAVNQLGESLGSLCSFTTLEASEPDADTDDATNIQGTTSVLHGSIEKNGGFDVTDYGFYYGTDSDNLYMKVSLGYAGAWKGDFSATITGLNPGTKYYFRAYAINKIGEDKGSRYSFTTISVPVPTAVPTTAPTATPTSLPTNLSAPVIYTSVPGIVNKDTGSINVGWNSVDTSAYYYLTIRKVSTGTSVWTFGSSITSTSFTIGSDVLKNYLDYNTNYYIYVTAHKGKLSSGESNPVYFTTGARPTVTPTPTPSVSTYIITGKVKYPNGVVMAGAVVRVNGSDKWMSITDANGNYRIPNVSSGWHILTVDYGNYKQYSKSINIPSADVNFDDIYMHGYTIDGYIKYPNSQKPIIGAKVSLDNTPEWTAYTDANGHFTINDALPGGYLLTVSYQGYENYSKWISFDKQDVPLGNIWIHGYSISGFIRDQDNKGIANALVYINDKSRTYTTNSNGYYEFNEVLGGGSYHTIYVEKSGYTPNPGQIGVTINNSNAYDQNIFIDKELNSTAYIKVGSYKIYYKLDKRAVHVDVSTPTDWEAVTVYKKEIAKAIIKEYYKKYKKYPTVSYKDLGAEILWHADLAKLSTELINQYNNDISNNNFINEYKYYAYLGIIEVRKHSNIADCDLFPPKGITEAKSMNDIITLIEKKGFVYNELCYASNKDEFLEIYSELWTKW